MEYRDFINTNMNDVITALNGSITPAPVNSELYRDFLNRKADDVITALNGYITPAPAGDELYRDFIERKFDDVIAGIGSYIPPLTFPTLTGSIVTFNSQYAGLPLKSHKIALTATQSGSGTPSPDNVRPINGYSVIGVSATGKNLFNLNALIANKGLDVDTGEEISQSTTKITPFIPVSVGDYFWNGSTTRIYYYDSNKAFIERGSLITNSSFNIGSGVGFIRFQASNVNWGISNLQLEKGDAATDYQPFGTYTTITIGSTVYGGEYDARTGVLTVTHKGVLWSDLTIQLYNGNIYQANVSDILRPTSGPERQQGIMSSNIKVCSTFAVNETMEDLSMLKLTDYVYIKISSASTATEAQAILGSGQLVYELATPIDIQLPPCPIDTLEGVNNIWADTGDTTLQYIKIGGNT